MKNLEPYQYRLLNERNELRNRLEKLMAFMHTDVFENVAQDERERLIRQSNHMYEYLGVLNERIKAIDA